MSNMTGNPRGDAGRDKDIAARLERDPANKDAKLDEALDESMDASDPPAVTAPRTTKTKPKPPATAPDEVRKRAS